MGKGLSLDIGMNTREVVKGSADIEKALDGVDHTLDELAREGDRAADKLDRSFTDALRDIQQESKRTGDSVGRNIERGTTSAKESVRELKTEGLQNIAETLSSTDGSLQSFSDGVQGTLGGVIAGLAGISPAAAAAAGGAALAFAGVTTELVKQEELTKRLRERFSALYQNAAEDGRTFLSEAQIQAEVLDILWNPDRVDEYNKAQQAVRDTGLDLTTVLRGLSGDQQAAADVVAVTSTRVDELKEKVSGFQGAVQGGNNPVLKGYLTQQVALEGIRNRYQQILDVQDENKQKAAQAQQILDSMSANEREQIKRTITADQGRWEALANNVAAANQLSVDIPTTIATPTVKDVLRRTQAALDKQQLRVKVGIVDKFNRRID